MASGGDDEITIDEDTLPCKPSLVEALTQRIKDLLGREDSGTASSKHELKELAQKLSVALESSPETIERLAFYVRNPFRQLFRA